MNEKGPENFSHGIESPISREHFLRELVGVVEGFIQANEADLKNEGFIAMPLTHFDGSAVPALSEEDYASFLSELSRFGITAEVRANPENEDQRVLVITRRSISGSA